MGERGGAHSWHRFIDGDQSGKKVPEKADPRKKRDLSAHGEGEKNIMIPVPPGKKQDKTKSASTLSLEGVPVLKKPGESEEDFADRQRRYLEARLQQIKRDQLLSIVLKGDPVQKKPGESEEDFADRQRLYLEGRLQEEQGESGEAFKARRDLARKYRQYVAAVTKLSAMLKVDLKRPKAVDLLRADYRRQLIRDVFEADRPDHLTGKSSAAKEQKKRVALRRLRDLFGITDMGDIFRIADLDAMSDPDVEWGDNGPSVWDLPSDLDLGANTNTDVKEIGDPHYTGLIEMALRGNSIAQATLENEFGIDGAAELLERYR